jgi:hypothetical protein
MLQFSGGRARPTKRFVPVKTVKQRSAATLHRSRALRVKQRTMLLHAVRAHLAEFGISAGAGIAQVTRLVGELAPGERTLLPAIARFTLETLARLDRDLQARLSEIEKRLASWHYQNDVSKKGHRNHCSTKHVTIFNSKLSSAIPLALSVLTDISNSAKDPPNRSSLTTANVSPLPAKLSRAARPRRSMFLPDLTSVNTRTAPACSSRMV